MFLNAAIVDLFSVHRPPLQLFSRYSQILLIFEIVLQILLFSWVRMST